MFSMDCISINQKGHLCIEGCDTLELAERYGTPLYVMSENAVRESCQIGRASCRERV